MRRVVMGLLLAVGLAGRSSWAECSATAAVSTEDVRRWLDIWKQREGVERPITLRFVHQSELGSHVIANVEWWHTVGQANILFTYPEELETVFHYSPEEARGWAQRAVIHELMHLVLGGLYEDGSGRGNAWLKKYPALDARMEAITDHLAVLLLRRQAPGPVPVARYIAQQVNSGPWKPTPEVRQRIMLQVLHALHAANEDDVLALNKGR